MSKTESRFIIYMCGIVGYVGKKDCTPILLNGLKSLEYRGYDSAGIAIINNNHIEIKKEKGRVKNLEELLENNSLSGTIGIAHTRWATHGKPSKINAHPHLDNSNTFVVVHNGIIENAKELRNFLEESNYTFLSETDTEVIPNLINYYYNKETKTKKTLLNAISNACKDLKGSFALLILCKDFPKIEIAVKKDSPLVIGKRENEYYIASDIPAICKYTDKFYFLNDNEIAVIEENSIVFYNFNYKIQKKELHSIAFDNFTTTKDGYSNFMLKEIFEQPKAILKTIKNRIRLGSKCEFKELSFTKEELSSIKKIYIVACGTAMHAGLVGKHIIQKLCNIPVIVDISSEFRYSNPFIDENTLCIFISQSGETADTIAALNLAKDKKSKILVITNVYNSSITRQVDNVLYTYAGPEIAVASTKAYTCQISLICLFAIFLAEQLKTFKIKDLEILKEELLNLPEKITTILQQHNLIKEFTKQIYLKQDMFFLGRGIDYITCLEGSLKVKEISYIHSEAYAAGELKHGPIALIEDDIPVISILTDSNLVEKTISNLQEVISRGATTFIITNNKLEKNNFDFVFNIPKANTLLSPILSIIPLQLFAYYISNEKGLDVDKPRNLAKSVTVE